MAANLPRDIAHVLIISSQDLDDLLQGVLLCSCKRITRHGQPRTSHGEGSLETSTYGDRVRRERLSRMTAG